ncbi:MAG TPA: DUF5134 domain-containing protein [Actinospica sp.]|nr:DUF5134 domain-containing protein [Actinospica sp.]
MNAPGWLTALVAILVISAAAYSLWRLVISRVWGRGTDYETDALHLAVGVAAAGMVADWAHTLPRPVWAVLFAAAAVYFLARRRWAHFAGSAVVVYMFLAGVAPTTIHGSTAGQYTMAGMDGMILDQTITYPTIGLIFVVGLCFYAVTVLNAIEPLSADTGRGNPLLLAPRSVDVCRVVIVLVLAYAILTKIV